MTRRMVGYKFDGRRSHSRYHGIEHDYDRECDDSPKCRPVEPEPEPDVSPRASVLNEARDLITGDRNAQYGPPTQDFRRTADLLNALGYRRIDADGETIKRIEATDVGLMMIQLKMSRVMHSRGKRDHYVDIAGYAGCAYECSAEESDNG